MKARLKWIEKVDNASFLVVTTSYLGTASKTRSSFSHLKVGFHSFFKDTMDGCIAICFFPSIGYGMNVSHYLLIDAGYNIVPKLYTRHHRSLLTHDIFQFQITCLFFPPDVPMASAALVTLSEDKGKRDQTCMRIGGDDGATLTLVWN